MIKGRELIEKIYSDQTNLVEASEYEEDRGVKNYDNGSIHVIFDGRRPINCDFKEALGEDLINALDNLFKELSDKPLMIDVIFNIRKK